MAKYCPDCSELLGGRSQCECGWKEPSTNRQPIGSQSIPEQPGLCSKAGCNTEANITIAVVRDKSGRVRSGSFKQFGYTKKIGDNFVNIVRDGYQFLNWIGRCSDCYIDDQIKAGTNQGIYPGLASTNK